MLPIRTITVVSKVLTYIVTSITAHPTRLIAILVLMSVSTFKTEVILYFFIFVERQMNSISTIFVTRRAINEYVANRMSLGWAQGGSKLKWSQNRKILPCNQILLIRNCNANFHLRAKIGTFSNAKYTFRYCSQSELCISFYIQHSAAQRPFYKYL